MRRLSQLARRKSRADAAPAAEQAAEPGDEDPNPLVAQQKKTFRRWCNAYLDDRQLQVKHILKDWEDGILLINLMEVLAETNLGKHNKRPVKMESQKGENLNIALKFIGTHVKIVNIGSKDIMTGNQTIVLGLIWTLILRWGLKLRDGKVGLLKWVNARCKAANPAHPEVTNFTKDMMDGMVIATIVAAARPDLLDIKTCSPSDPVGNLEKAFAAAAEGLQVPRLLDAKDVATNPDEKSVIAYIGQLNQAIGGEVPEGADSKNKNGSNNNAGAAAKPAPPKDIIPDKVEVSEETPKSCRVTWRAPPGSKAVKLRVALANAPPGDSAVPVKEIAIPPGDDPSNLEGSTLIEGLKPNKAYVATLVAVAAKDGKDSKPSPDAGFKTLPLGAPKAPRISDITTTTVHAAWDPVPLAVSYKLQVDEYGDDTWGKEIPVPEGETECDVDGLTPGTKVGFRVVASLGPAGDSDPGSVADAKTLMQGLDDAPQVSDVSDTRAHVGIVPLPPATKFMDGPRVSEESPTGCKVTWRPPPHTSKVKVLIVPAGNPTGAPVASKEVPVGGAGSDPITAVFANELDPNTDYLAKVIPVTEDGKEQDASPGTDFTTLPTGGAPGKPVVSDETPSGCKVTCLVPPGTKKVKVRVAPSPEAVAAATAAGEDPASLMPVVRELDVDEDGGAGPTEVVAMIEGLKPDTPYVATVVGVSAKDGKDTAPSPETPLVTLAVGAPPPPVLSDVTTTSIKASWDPIPDAQSYKLLVDEKGDDTWGREIPVAAAGGNDGPECIVDQLTPGATVGFRVVAVGLPSGGDSPPGTPAEGTTKLLAVPIPVAEKYLVKVREKDNPKPWDQVRAEEIAHPEDALVLDELHPGRDHEVVVVAVSPDGVESEPSPIAAFATSSSGPRYALVTGANSEGGVSVLQELLLTGSNEGELVKSATAFGFENGFTKVFALARQPYLASLVQLQETSPTLVVVEFDSTDKQTMAPAAKLLPSNVHLLVNNADLPRSTVSYLLS